MSAEHGKQLTMLVTDFKSYETNVFALVATVDERDAIVESQMDPSAKRAGDLLAGLIASEPVLAIREARLATSEGQEEMKQMTEAMADIKASSGEISKIIRMIDEIAFQTNLLALNAAVDGALGEINAATTQVNDTLAGILSASSDQAQGIEKVNFAITSLDRVKQQNPGNSEELAAGAEETAAQAATLKGLVARFKIAA